MDRRQFLQTGAQATLLGSVVSAGSISAVAAEPRVTAAPAVLNDYTAKDHRQRLQNIAYCNRRIRGCMRKHLVTSYLPGQCLYCLGMYPRRTRWAPNDYDEQELDKLRDQGIQIIQLHEEWGDSHRLFGSHKLAPQNPAGFRRFVEMVHSRGMKVIVYVSTGYFERTDPDFRPQWSRGKDLVELYYSYAKCSPVSTGWRAYILPHLVRILDDYGVDGFHNDLGYRKLANSPLPPTSDEVLAFEESAAHDGGLADLLALIYAEVARRGGIVKIHASNVRRPLTELKVYDYLWVGETVTNGDRLREAVKNHPPYVTPCLDMSRAKVENEDELYLHSIPYLQFPMLMAGRPFTGEIVRVPGLQYQPPEKCFWTRHCRAIWEYYQAHPEGPHSYFLCDSVPGRPEIRPTYVRWLKQYLPMVEEGTWTWLEIGDSDFFSQPLPKHVVASAFANRSLYLVLANYGRTAQEIETTEAFVPADGAAARSHNRWELPARSLRILRRAVA